MSNNEILNDFGGSSDNECENQDCENEIDDFIIDHNNNHNIVEESDDSENNSETSNDINEESEESSEEDNYNNNNFNKFLKDMISNCHNMMTNSFFDTFKKNASYYPFINKENYKKELSLQILKPFIELQTFNIINKKYTDEKYDKICKLFDCNKPFIKKFSSSLLQFIIDFDKTLPSNQYDNELYLATFYQQIENDIFEIFKDEYTEENKTYIKNYIYVIIYKILHKIINLNHYYNLNFNLNIL
jgi:hypothetical protein